MEQRLYDIAKTLDPELAPLTDLRDEMEERDQKLDVRWVLAERLRRVPVDRPVLFVVDNVPEAQPGEPPRSLDAWCPTLGQITVLATSRQRTLIAGPTAVDALELDTLDRDSAVQMLTTAITAYAKAHVWVAIANWVGCLPLALEVLNGALRARAITPAELHAMATERAVAGSVDKLVEVIRPHVPAGSVRGVTEALCRSYAILTSPAQDAARVLAQLGPEPIPTALVDALHLASPLRAELTARSFVAGSPSSDGVEVYGRMHRVIADFVRHQSADAPADRRRAVAALRSIVTYDALKDPGARRLLDACMPHAEHLQVGITADDRAAGVNLQLRGIDRSSDRPEFRQIAYQLAESIRSGELSPGDQLPSESALAHHYGVSRLTIRRAVGVLVQEEGLVNRLKGRGSYVREPKAVVTVGSWNRGRSTNSPLNMYEEPSVVQHVYESAEVPAPDEVARALGLVPGETVLVRRAFITLNDRDNTPMQLADSFIPLDLVTQELRDPNAAGINYMLIEMRSGLHIGMLREYVHARMPSADELRDLALEPDTPVVDLSRIAYASTDNETWDEQRESADEFAARSRPVEFFKSTIVGPLHMFVYDLPCAR